MGQSAAQVIAAHQEALEHMRGHHGRGGVTGDGVLAQQQAGIGKGLQRYRRPGSR